VVLLWASLPPVDCGWLAWLAPAPWVLLARQRELPGRRPYVSLWLVNFLFWLAAVHWLRLPHWATSFGWLALAAYFAFYLPVFIGLVRVAAHRLRVSVVLTAPVVWMGLELARGHLLTGMTMASLGHTQYRWITLIQLSDLVGAYGVSFVVMFVAACAARMVPCDARGWTLWPPACAALVVAAALAYGTWRTFGEYVEPGLRIALIQGSIDAQLKTDDTKRAEIYDHYLKLSEKAVQQYGPLDLLVWPETMFRDTLVSGDPDAAVPSQFEGSAAEWQAYLPVLQRRSQQLMIYTARLLETPLILGVDTQHFGRQRTRYANTAVYVSPSGEILGRYDKMHLVMFGEYVPFAGHLPWLQRLTPLSVSLTPGSRPAAFEVEARLPGQAAGHPTRRAKGDSRIFVDTKIGTVPTRASSSPATSEPPRRVRLAPNICYETVLPHLIRAQVRRLRAQGAEPDVLVNLTNDGWFRGSSELDMHLVCGVFRAIECRKPLVIAANTGFSAWIDGDGRIRAQGPRREAGVVLAEVHRDTRRSWYLAFGDWAAGACLVACGLLAAVAGWDWLRKPLPGQQ